MERIELGLGVLEWHPLERKSDRYGSVFLVDGRLERRRLIDLEGTLGVLVAEVVDPRVPHHPGDWFHGIYPEMPERGEEVVLGTGVCFHLPPVDRDSSSRVGLLPPDGRRTQWLDLKALYRTHGQMVRLWFLPRSTRKKDVLFLAAKRSGLEPRLRGNFSLLLQQGPQPREVGGQFKWSQEG